MIHLLEWLNDWMARETRAVAYLLVCIVVAIQTCLIFGR